MTNIHSTTNNNAVAGDTTNWTVTITIPAHTPQDTYILDIEYDESANAPPIFISSISPTTNWNNGDIYITGYGFTNITSITVGGVACLSHKVISTTSASCVLPPRPNSSVNAVVIASSTLGASNDDGMVTYDGANKGIMQTFTSSICSAMPVGLAQNWTDARDGNQYRIKKMLDNKCWMIDNLAYAGGGTNTYGDVVPIGAGTGNITFANACANVTAPCTGVSPWTSSTTRRYMTTNNYTGGDLTDRNGNTIHDTTATLYSDTQCTNSPTGSGTMQSECLSYLYNWCAAIGLDSGTSPTCASVSNTGSGAGYTTTGVIGISDASGGKGGESKGSGGTSICPTGWRLPVARVGSSDNTLNEFAILNASMNSNAYNPTPSTSNFYQNWQPAGSFSVIGSGYFAVSTGLVGQSAGGYYWSSSLRSSMDASRLGVGATSVSPGTLNYFKYSGATVRCVL